MPIKYQLRKLTFPQEIRKYKIQKKIYIYFPLKN